LLLLLLGYLTNLFTLHKLHGVEQYNNCVNDETEEM